MILPSVVEWTHWIVRRTLRAGDIAVDATVGNGHDLAMMASCVWPGGKVIGLDVQEHALQRAELYVRQQGLGDAIGLHLCSHEDIDRICASEGIASVRAAMYNLGYLPGGDKTIRTQPESTVRSLEKALLLLAPGGVMTIVVYRGHPGGQEEADAVYQWCQALPSTRYECVHYTSLLSAAAPQGIAIAHRVTR
jgi:predicted methyltransferase